MSKTLKEYLNSNVTSLDKLASLCLTKNVDLVKLFKSEGDIEIKYHNNHLINLSELLCYSGNIEELGYDLPAIELVIDFFSEKITFESLNHEDSINNNFSVTDSLLSLEILPKWIFVLNGHLKHKLIIRLNYLLEKGLEEYANNRIYSNKDVLFPNKTEYDECSLEDLSDLVLSSFNSSALPNNSSQITKENTHINQTHIQKECSKNNIDSADIQIKIYKKNLKSLIYSLKETELDSLVLSHLTEEHFIRRVSHPDHISKLFTIETVFFDKIVKNVHFPDLQRKIKTYCVEQNINNLNVILFKLLFSIRIADCSVVEKDKLYKKLINLLCFDCIVFFISEKLFDTSFYEYLEKNKHLDILLQTNKNRITKILLEEYAFEKRSEENTSLKMVSDIKRPVDQTSRLYELESSSDTTSEKCPFYSIFCETPQLSNFKISLCEYISYTLKNKSLTQSEAILAEEYGFSIESPIEETIFNKRRKFNATESFNVKIMNQIITSNDRSNEIITYIVDNLACLSEINQVKCFLWMFDGSTNHKNIEEYQPQKEIDVLETHSLNINEEINHHKSTNLLYDRHWNTLKSIFSSLNQLHLKNIINSPLKLDCLMPFIHLFGFNIKKFYLRIENKPLAIKNLEKGKEKNEFIKQFICDKTFGKLEKIETLNSLDFNNLEESHLTDLLQFCNTSFQDEQFDQLHLLILKDFSDSLLETSLMKNFNSKNKKLFDLLILAIRKQAREMGIELKIRNIKES